MPQIEGFTPDMLWTAIIVLLGLAAVYLLVDKVVVSIRGHVERRRMSQEGPRQALADEISGTVIEKLQPRLGEIDRKLLVAQTRIDDHDRRLSEIDNRFVMMNENMTMILRGLNMMIMHEITGNDIDGLKHFKEELDSFMAKR